MSGGSMNHLRKFQEHLMKKRVLCAFFAFAGLAACHEEKFDPEKPSVNRFVDQLLNGEYDPLQPIPAFSPEQIPALLRYANDLRAIPSFPINPVSSRFVEEYRLGECMLWTIESIRLSYGQALALTALERYPSLNPILINQGAQRPDRRATDAEVRMAFQAYSRWWYNDTLPSFAQKRAMNPLQNTPFAWR